MPERTISVIIPAWKEGEELGRLIRSLAPLAGVEVIVAVPAEDGETARVAAASGARTVISERGRGPQLIAGAAAARGDILLFCHADTALPEGWVRAVRAALSRPGVAAGAFRLRIGAPGFSYRAIECMANLRSRFLRLPYGDQGLFATRAMYDAAGGYGPLPLMEDVDMVRRLARLGRVAIVEDAALTSARRWKREGVLYGTLRNWTLMVLYLLGVSPVTLAAWYRR